MANRPRRPNPDQTASPDAEGGTPSAGGEAMSATAPEAASTGEGTPPEPSVSAPETKTVLPPPEHQPSDLATTAAADQAGREDERTGRRAVSPAEAETTDAFAAEEGFADGQPGRGHLGEFEDDETLSPDEDRHQGPRPVTDAFSRTDQATAPAAPGGGSIGALVGAAFAGAILALVGGAILLSAGIVPGLGTGETNTEQFAERSQVDTLSGEVGTLRADVDQLRSAQAAGGASPSYASASDLSILSDRLTIAEQALQDGSGEAPEALQTAQGAQETAQGAQEAASGATEAALAAQGLAEAAQASAESAEASAGEAAAQIAAFESRIAAIEEANRRAAAALAAANLKAAIDRGGAFATELDGFAEVNGGGEAVDALRAYAPDGVETPAELRAAWPEVEAETRRMLAAPSADAGVGDRLMAGLSSLVTVRPTGEAATEAEGPAARLSRMDAALASGDLAGFLAERSTLPAEAQAPSQDFADRVEARRRASEIIDAAIAAVVGAQTAG